MDSFRTRRHTAMLALVAIGISVGIVTWSIVTIANLNTGAIYRPASIGSVAAVQESNGSAKTDFGNANSDSPIADAFARRVSARLVPEAADPRFSRWQNDLDWLRAQALAVRGTERAPAWQASTFAMSSVASAAPSAIEMPATATLPAPNGEAAAATVAASTSGSAFPEVSSSSDPAPVRSASIDPVGTLPAAAPMTSRAVGHIPHEPTSREIKGETAHAATAKPHRIASRGTYLEKSVEQGDSGEVAFRVRRRACTPGNMLDVCYMPAADRQRIVIERY